MISCPKCGAHFEDSAKFCTVCGTAISPPAQTETNHQQVCQNPQFQNNQNPYNSYANGAQPNLGYPPPPPYGAPVSQTINQPTISEIYSKAFALLGKKTILLWGLSLLHTLLCSLAVVFGFLPIISIPIILVLNVGMASIFLDAYRGKKISSEQLFLGFKNFWHFCRGMAWMLLWIFIWGLIPLAGIVFAVMKAYSFRFVPYILLSNPEISPADALRESVKQTQGYCGRMFGADIIIIGGILIAMLILFILSYIPYMGILFVIINFLLAIAVFAFAPLLLGVIKAAFYDEISNKNNQEPDVTA